MRYFKLNGNHIIEVMKFIHLCFELVSRHVLQLCNAVHIESSVFLVSYSPDNFIQAGSHFIFTCTIKTQSKQYLGLAEDRINDLEHFQTYCIQPV